jgi:hypothetical protein
VQLTDEWLAFFLQVTARVGHSNKVFRLPGRKAFSRAVYEKRKRATGRKNDSMHILPG